MLGRTKWRREAEAVIRDAGKNKPGYSDSPDGGIYKAEEAAEEADNAFGNTVDAAIEARKAAAIAVEDSVETAAEVVEGGLKS